MSDDLLSVPVPPVPAGAAESVPSAATACDEDLVRRAGRGDRDALATLAGTYERMLLGLARGLLDGREDLACDAVQDAWVRVIRSGANFGGASSVKTWLYRIVINRCHDLRAAHNQKARTERLIENRPRETSPEPSPDGAAALETTTMRASVRDAVAGLKPDQRLLVTLCYHQGLTHPQVAEVLGVPVGTVKSRLNAVLNQLRSSLSKEMKSEHE